MTFPKAAILTLATALIAGPASASDYYFADEWHTGAEAYYSQPELCTVIGAGEYQEMPCAMLEPLLEDCDAVYVGGGALRVRCGEGSGYSSGHYVADSGEFLVVMPE